DAKAHAVHVHRMRQRHARSIIGESPYNGPVQGDPLVARDRSHLEATRIEKSVHVTKGELGTTLLHTLVVWSNRGSERDAAAAPALAGQNGEMPCIMPSPIIPPPIIPPPIMPPPIIPPPIMFRLMASMLNDAKGWLGN